MKRCTVRTLLVFAALLVGVASPPALAQNELFVGNAGNNSVKVFSRTASGNTAPIRTLAGAATGLSFIQGLAVDVTNNELFVANGSGPAITVYSLSASGNTAPLRTLTGAATGMTQPIYIAVDPTNNELFVTNGNQTVTVYSRTASGNSAPLRTLSTVPAANSPIGLTLDLTNNDLVVGTSGSTIDVYSRTASGNTPALRSLGGAATGLVGPIGLGVDVGNNELFAANGSVAAPSVTVYNRTASGNTAPLRTLSGAATGLVGPHALALDLANNELFVGNTINANSITVYARGASGNTAPLRTLSGAATGISGPVGIAVTTGAPPTPPGMLGASSRKVHGAAGTFDLALSFVAPPNINHNPTTEPRQGPAQTIVFTFDKAITGATVSISEGVATAGAPTLSGNDVVVGLTNVTDQQYVTVSLTNVASADGGTGGSGSVRVGFLAGDVNQTRVVTVADLGLVNAVLAQLVTAANYLKDVNASGTLSIADKGVTNANLTRALSTP
jgi:hypothetical protein